MRLPFLLIGVLIFFQGCANRQPQAIRPIGSLAVLHVDTLEQFRRAPQAEAGVNSTEAGSATATAANAAAPTAVVYPYHFFPYPYAVMSGPRVYLPGLHGRGAVRLGNGRSYGVMGAGGATGLLLYAIEANKQNARVHAEALMDRVALDPALALTQALNKRMMKLTVPVLPVTNLPLAARARAEGNFALLREVSSQADTVMDVRVHEFSYDHSFHFGFRPMLGVSVTLYDSMSGGYLGQYDYWADHKEAHADPRRFTLPKSMSFYRLEELANAEKTVREGYLAVMERVAEQIIIDVQANTVKK
jgi:hypothetical protein